MRMLVLVVVFMHVGVSMLVGMFFAAVLVLMGVDVFMSVRVQVLVLVIALHGSLLSGSISDVAGCSFAI
jgi:hypothetical protein